MAEVEVIISAPDPVVLDATPNEKTAIFLTPAISALLANSTEPPVTLITESTAAPVVTAQSVPPDQLPATNVLNEIASHAEDEEELILDFNGTEISDIALVYLDEDGKEAFVPVEKIPEFLAGEALPSGFVLSGKLKKLYGIIPGTRLYINYGTAVSHITWVEQYVKVADSVSLGKLIPSLKENEDLNAIQLENVQLSYVSGMTLTTTPGTWLDTDVVFSGPLQPISDVLRDVFGQTRPALHMRALVSGSPSWNKVPKPPGLNVWGMLENISVKIGSLEVVTLGVQITANKELVFLPKMKDTWKFGWGFMGTALMHLPGSVTPLEMSLLVRQSRGFISLDLDVVGDLPWEDALGIRGFDIQNVQMHAQIPTTNPNMKNVSFGITAIMNFGDIDFYISGTHGPGETRLTAWLKGLTLADLIRAVENLFEVDLEEPDFDLEFRDLQFQLSSLTGIVLAGTVVIDGYTSTSARIAISKAGISIFGAITNVHIGEVTLTQAAINITIPLSASKSASPNAVVRPLPASFSISGNVKFGDLEISAGLFFSKSTPSSTPAPGAANTSDKAWIIYGEFKDKNGLKASKLMPALEGSFLNFSLRNIAFMASSGNAIAPPGFLNSYNYAVTKGVQLLAAFDSIDEIDSLTRSRNPALTLKAYYTNGLIGLDIIMPNENAVMVMKNSNLRPTPFTLGIKVTDNGPALALKSGFDLIVPNQVDPLRFAFGLNADMIGANGYGEMLGYWKNPLGISDQLEVGDLALQMGIIYAVFFSTGTPSSLAITGGIKVGRTQASVALAISENPGELLVSGSVKNLAITDIVDFARKVTKLNIPEPDSDFLTFEEMSMYMSSGVTIGTRYFPPGFSASGSILAFGKRASMACTMGGAGVAIKGALDAFELGPLSVRGRRGQNLVLDIEMTATTHKVFFDGEAKLGPLLAALYLNALQQGKGEMILEFDAEMAFTDLFKMTAKGKARNKIKGDAAKKGLGGVEFDVEARMQQDIVNYVMAQVNAQFMAAQYAATQSFDEARASLDRAEKAFAEGVRVAEGELAKAQKAWQAKSDSVNKAFNDAKTTQTNRVNQLKEDVRKAKGEYDAAVDRATRKLEQTQITAASEIGKARGTLEKTKSDVDRDISSKQQILINAEQDMDRRFGNAAKDIEKAQNDVNNKLRELNDVQRRMSDKQRQIDKANVLNKIKLGFEMTPIAAEYGVKKAAFETANGVLSAAKAIVQGPGYKLAEGTMFAARGTLEAAKITGKAAIDGASSTLQGVIIAQNGLIDSAQQGLQFTKTAGNELKLWKIAEEVLDRYLKESNDLLSGLQRGVDGLMQTAEYIAFTAASKALQVAKENIGDMDILRKGVDAVEKGSKTGLRIAQWVTKALGNLFDIETIIMTAQLGALHKDGRFTARIIGDVANKRVDFTTDFTLGDAKKFVEGIFKKLWNEIEQGILSIDL
ncbi:hypothetical protein TWF481_012150 [Arthrobotrys musiformis]|uniref:Uncharacterized protein n=1 Tax=Arthrobotrys musiformis TaxID=47236 RepID=A0AAV9VY55_9PEZI